MLGLRRQASSIASALNGARIGPNSSRLGSCAPQCCLATRAIPGATIGSGKHPYHHYYCTIADSYPTQINSTVDDSAITNSSNNNTATKNYVHGGGSVVLPPPPIATNNNTNIPSTLMDRIAEVLEDAAIWMVSTLKRRNRKMNKHKLRKRRKRNRKKKRKI